MSAIALASMPEDEPDLNSLSNDQLLQRLTDALSVTLAGLCEGARIVKIFDTRGVKLDAKRIPILRQLRQIADGWLLPETMMNYYYRATSLFRKIAAIPTAEQQRLVNGEPVPLLVYDPIAGQRTILPVDPLYMDKDQIEQAFHRDHIRWSEAEQAAFLASKREKAALPIPECVGPFKVDRERDGVMLGKRFISRADLKAAIRMLG